MKLKPRFCLAGAQRGQSMVEYAALCAILAVVLFAPIPGDTMSVGQKLADALRQSYKALSFFLSLP